MQIQKLELSEQGQKISEMMELLMLKKLRKRVMIKRMKEFN